METPDKVTKKTAALVVCLDALRELSEHHAFAGDAPEFNKGGIAYEAIQIARQAIRKDEVPEGMKRPSKTNALIDCIEALTELSGHQEFGDDSPEFTKGGMAYEALQIATHAAVKKPKQPTKLNFPEVQTEQETVGATKVDDQTFLVYISRSAMVHMNRKQFKKFGKKLKKIANE